jgi:hypothetical protein
MRVKVKAPIIAWTPTTMSLKAARDLSIADLLRVLGEKLDLEYTRLRETALPPKSVVSAPRSTHFGDVAAGSDIGGLYRLKA